MDAHGDWNNEHITPSGSMHGMPFSAICGHGPHCMVDFGQPDSFVDPKHCVVVGARDLDRKEKTRMKQAGMHVFTMNDIETRGIATVMKEAIEIAGTDTSGIHVSFDVDTITPEEAPGTGTPVQYGLTTREAYLTMSMLSNSKKLLSMDVVEVNPILDIRNKTALIAVGLIEAALGKQAY